MEVDNDTSMKTAELIFAVLNALGSLATFFAFLFLFKKDKDKEKQLEQLTLIAETLKLQNESLGKQNDLITQQIDIFRNTSILKGQDDGAIERLEAIENKKLRLSVQPTFRMRSAGYSGSSGDFWVTTENIGESATIENLEVESDDVNINQLNAPVTIDKNNRLKIEGHAKGAKHIKDADYKINIHLKDKLGNKYIARINKEDGKTNLDMEEIAE